MVASENLETSDARASAVTARESQWHFIPMSQYKYNNSCTQMMKLNLFCISSSSYGEMNEWIICKISH